MPDSQIRHTVVNAIERMARKLPVIALLAVALCAGGARADDPAMPKLRFSGFGTLGLVHSSENKADFTSSVFKPGGAGHTRAWSGDVDSRIGVQATATFTSQLAAVVQVISEQRFDNSYAPTVEWANVRYQFTPDFSIRAGRIVLPGFLVSDYRKVGYANPWVRPPAEVYNLAPISSSDGVDASYRVRIGDFVNTVQVTYGKSESGFPAGGRVRGKNLWGITYTGETGAITARIAYRRANVTVDAVRPLFDGFRQFGPQGVALANRYDIDGKPFAVIGLGAAYDPGDWFVMGEWGSRSSQSALGKRTALYVSGGFRFRKLTPYVTYAQTKANSNTSDPGLTLSALPPSLAEAAASLNAGLNAILLNSVPQQETVSAGVRWDFARNGAFKLQFDHTRLGVGSHGNLINLQPGFRPGGTVNVFSVTLDFVF